MLSAVAAALPAAASAHLGHQIGSAERYLKLDVAGGRARVVVSLTLGEGEGARLLADADLDSDGAVSEAERDRHLERWARGLADEVRIYRGGARVPVVWSEGWLDPIGPVRAAPLTVELVAAFDVSGEVELRVEDRMIRREVYERTDVAFRAREGAELLACSVGPPQEGACHADLAYGPDLSPDAPVMLHATLRTPVAARALTFTWREAAVLAGALLTVLLLTAAAARPRGRASR